MSPRRATWIREGLSGLGHELKAHGVALLHTPGSISDWLRANLPHTLLYSHAVATEERSQEAEVHSLGITTQTFWTHTLLTPGEIPGGLDRLPPTFTPFRHRVEREALSFDCITHQTSPNYHSPTSSREAFPFEAGEPAALARLDAYARNPNGAAQYKTRRNGLLGTEFSTKFSPWLASGAISPQRIWQTCLDLEDELGAQLPDFAENRAIEDANNPFASRGRPEAPHELTSRVNTAEISRTKELLSRPYSDRDHLDVALATNRATAELLVYCVIQEEA